MSASPTTCRSHGTEKVKYGHWRICPQCEPEFWRSIESLYATPVKPLELAGKGIARR